MNRWGYYPLILIGSWAFGTINGIHDFIEPGHKIFWLSVLDVGTAALMVIPIIINIFFLYFLFFYISRNWTQPLCVNWVIVSLQ